MGITFGLTVFAWIFFRAENISHALSILSEIASHSLFDFPKFASMKNALVTVILILFFLWIEWMGRERQHAFETFGLTWKRAYRYAFYYFIILLILWFGGDEQQFIYFQF